MKNHMYRRLIVLLAAVMVTSLAVVKTRHESRQLFVKLQTYQAERDALVIEWGKLLLEEGAWSQHRRVEVMARNRLDMSTPDSARIRVVRLVRGSTP
ncbi:MAG: cell division protein FtsL [Sulfuricaulis sp.]|jgi:cell division protein FtsL|uniref:cell division protein FtsL n=1 Tax=Sulfuricaulis sp. TaxID=2003553 RepID=UPI002B61877C|nr:cell division protein FtsL [Sulfuricaulis sp.]